jgi:hypothetical protein
MVYLTVSKTSMITWKCCFSGCAILSGWTRDTLEKPKAKIPFNAFASINGGAGSAFCQSPSEVVSDGKA